MNVDEYYGHGLSQDIEQNHRILSYSSEYDQLENFQYDEISKKYKKDVLKTDLPNAFLVTTKAIYNNEEFLVWAYNEISKIITIYTENMILGEKCNFTKLTDRYFKQIEISEIEKIWEERNISEYNLPFPNKINKLQEIILS